jgi:hypothetical protein
MARSLPDPGRLYSLRRAPSRASITSTRAVAIDVFNDPELVTKLDIRGITA